MPNRQDYIDAFKGICGQANTGSYDSMLAVSTPNKKLDDRLAISFGVGGLVVLLVDPALYEELEADLKPLMRKILRDTPCYSRRKIEFYPITDIE